MPHTNRRKKKLKIKTFYSTVSCSANTDFPMKNGDLIIIRNDRGKVIERYEIEGLPSSNGKRKIFDAVKEVFIENKEMKS
jgi:hypothetical protein